MGLARAIVHYIVSTEMIRATDLITMPINSEDSES